MITLDLNRTVDKLTLAFPTGATLNKVIKYSIRDLLRWLRRRILQVFRAETGIPQKQLDVFKRVRIQMGNTEAYFWLGLNPLPLHLAGKVTQTASGVSVKGKSYEGAFYQRIYTGEKKVWIRSSRNRQLNHPTYRAKKRYRTFSGEVSRSRFPVEILGIELEPVADALDERLENMAAQKFAEILSSKLASFFQ